MSNRQAHFTKSDLKAFLSSNKAQTNPLLVGVEQRKKMWLESLHNLYAQIKVWLEEVGVEYEERLEPLYEQFAGEYEVPVLILFFTGAREKIGFYPKGMFVLGADGKVEVAGRFMSVNLIEKTWGVWEIVGSAPGKIERKEWSAENFYSLIKDLISVG